MSHDYERVVSEWGRHRRGRWPWRLICKRRGHNEQAYRVNGGLGVLEPHCTRCGETWPVKLGDPPAPGGLPPADSGPTLGVLLEDARAGDMLEVDLETGRLRVSRSTCDRPFP